MGQLTQGATAERLAAAVAVGAVASVFPILGATTLLCLLCGYLFRLNQPLLQAVNYGLFPFQLLFMPLFLRAGEWIFNQPPVPFSPSAMKDLFLSNPGEFFRTYGLSGGLAVVAWAIFAVVVGGAIFLAFRTVFRGIAKRRRSES